MRSTRFILLCLFVLPSACLEMPISNIDKTETPIVRVDAGADSGVVDPQVACLACLAAPEDPGPGCQGPYDACKRDEKCNMIINCGFEQQCLQGARRAFIGCGLPCVSKAGVLTPDDPVLVLASNLFQCFTNGPCGDICFSAD